MKNYKLIYKDGDVIVTLGSYNTYDEAIIVKNMLMATTEVFFWVNVTVEEVK